MKDSNKKIEEENLGSSEAPLITAGAMVDYRESWRVFKIMSEFVEGYHFLGELKNEVTILGSARLAPNNKYYKIAVDLGRLLGKNGFTTITGGGPGIMEAANRGAYEVGGELVGINIQLPFEQRINPYVKKSVAFYYFFTRKVMLTAPANAFVFFPGGFGTLDEFFEVVDLIEQGYLPDSPIILVGSEFWQPVLNFLKDKSLKMINAISEENMANWYLVDTAEDAFEHIKDTADRPNTYSPALGPDQSREAEWRIFRIMSELVEGFDFLSGLKNNISVLGTKSITSKSKYYEVALEMGRHFAKAGYSVATGGGPGIMEAANRGAYEAGGESIGINMHVSGLERRNKYLTSSASFSYPFVRKLIITTPSNGFIFFPGGFGTLHQLFELLTLVETGKIKKIPLCLYDSDFWKPLQDLINKMFVDFHTISTGDRDLCKIVENIEEAYNCFDSK